MTGLSVRLPGVEGLDFTVAVLEPADSQEGAVEVFQVEAVGAEDEILMMSLCFGTESSRYPFFLNTEAVEKG